MSLKTPTQMDYTAPYVLGQIREFIFSDSLIDLETFFVKEFDNIADDVDAMSILFNNKTIVDMILNNDLYMEKVFRNSKMISGMMPESLLFNKCLNNKSWLSKLLVSPEATNILYDDLILSEKVMCAIFDTEMFTPSAQNSSVTSPLRETRDVEGIARYADNKSSRYLNASVFSNTSSTGSNIVTVSVTITLDLSNVSKLIWYTNFNGYYDLREYRIDIDGNEVLKKTSKEHGETNDDMIEYTVDVKSFTGEVPIIFTTSCHNKTGTQKTKGVYMALNRLRLEV